MFPKKIRMDSNKIAFVARKGKRFTAELFELRAWFDDKLPASKFSISISTSISKHSTVRNRIKRKLREVIKKIEPKFKKGEYMILIKSPALKDMQNDDIEKSLSAIAPMENSKIAN